MTNLSRCCCFFQSLSPKCAENMFEKYYKETLKMTLFVDSMVDNGEASKFLIYVFWWDKGRHFDLNQFIFI